MSEKLYCPFCKGELKVTHQDRYQDLCEHVSDPNGTPSLKDGYDCLNEECIAFGTHTWIVDGDYFSKRPDGITYREWDALREQKAGSSNFHAIGSFQYHYERGKQAIKKREFKINLHWYKLVFRPKEKGWDYPEAERHMPSIWRWEMEIWKKTEDHSHITLIPIHRMVIYKISEFNRTYKHWKETGSRSSLQEAYKDCMGLDYFHKPDGRAYVKISRFIISLLHRKKSAEVIENYLGK
jgi:hypothetical protein